MDEKRNWIGALLSQRQVVPRWHSPQAALHAGERDSARATVQLRNLPTRWLASVVEQVDQGQTHASVELAELRFLLGAPLGEDQGPDVSRVQEIWQRAAEHDGARPPMRAVTLEGDWLAIERSNIARMRHSLRRYPQQPFVWSELARAYIVLGEDKKAKRAMACAVQLASRSAYVRRSAARMHLHLNDAQAALWVVRQHPNFSADPRMVSADIAIAARKGLPVHHAKRGLSMLDDTNLRPAHLSELAAALGTIELEAGKHKRSRALFARSLVDPSENTLAQVQWATERDHVISVPIEAWQVPRSYEAHALAARLEGDWDSVLSECELWLQEEPFAVRPAILGSFSTFSVDQMVRSERLATQALVANPHSVDLRNNRAVARAYLGDTVGALADVKDSLGCDKQNLPYLLATLGLIGYRSGDQELGDMGYRAALAQFVKQKNAPSGALACLFWIRELARIGDPSVFAELEYIKRNLMRLTGGRPEPEITSMIESLEATLAQGSFVLATTANVIDEAARAIFHRFEPQQASPDWRGRFAELL